jgi:hypothetical protein
MYKNIRDLPEWSHAVYRWHRKHGLHILRIVLTSAQVGNKQVHPIVVVGTLKIEGFSAY